MEFCDRLRVEARVPFRKIPQGGAQPKVGAVLPIQEDRKAALWRWKKTNILGNLKYFRQLWIKSELEMLRKEDNAVTS